MVAVASKIAAHKGRTVGRKRKPMPKEIRRTLAGRFGLRLERHLSESGLSVAEFAQRIGKTEEAVRTYLRGTSAPALQDWPLIAKALGLDSYRDLLP